MPKILIAGLGSIGRRHLRNLVTLGETDIVLLRSHRATLPDDEVAGYPVETEIHAALKKHRPRAVIVANPTALHLDVAVPAARQGCAILLEKPISASMNGVTRLQSALARSGAKVLVGFQFRFHPALLRAREVIQDGAIGRVISAHVHFGEYLPAWHPWEDYRGGYAARADLGGGVLLTQCHSLDYLPWLVREPEAVSGFVGKLSDLEVDVDDTAEIVLRFAGGQLGTIHLDYAQQPPSHLIEIEGTRGSLHCDLLAGTMRVYRAGNSAWEDFALPAGWERNTMFLDEMEHFLAVARGEMQPACNLEDGVRVMQLIEAVRRSSKSGRVVSLKR
jgi:predicted dehydrogenase